MTITLLTYIDQMENSLLSLIDRERYRLIVQVLLMDLFIRILNAFVEQLPNELLALVYLKKVIPIVLIELARYNFNVRCVLLLFCRDSFAFDVL